MAISLLQGLHVSDRGTRPACRVQSLEGQTSLPEVDYSGRGERLARVVADIIQGGQVVLTEAAWAHVQDQLPGQAQVRSADHEPRKHHSLTSKVHAVDKLDGLLALPLFSGSFVNTAWICAAEPGKQNVHLPVLALSSGLPMHVLHFC